MIRAPLRVLPSLYFCAASVCSAQANCPSEFARAGGEKIAFCEESVVPDSVVALARTYLGSVTNPSYQQEQYVLIAERTGVQRIGDCRGDAVAYQLTLEYAALRRVNAESARVNIFLPVDPKCPASGFVAVRAPDGTIVEPKVSQREAIEAARKKVDPMPAGWMFSHASLLPKSETPVTGWEWNVRFRGPEKGGCYEQRNLVVDAETGFVTANTEDATCY